MQRIAVSNRKGGSGKTTVAVNMAASWPGTGKRLVLDLDPQADATRWFGLGDSGEALRAALSGRGPLGDAIRAAGPDIDVAAGGEAMEAAMRRRIGPDAVASVIRSLPASQYSVIIIDCPPNLSDLVRTAWEAADMVLLPVDGPDAFRAVQRLGRAWEDARIDGEKARIVANRIDLRRRLDRELLEEAESRFGDKFLTSTIRESVRVRESSLKRTPLIDLLPHHPITTDIGRLVEEVRDA